MLQNWKEQKLPKFIPDENGMQLLFILPVTKI